MQSLPIPAQELWFQRAPHSLDIADGDQIAESLARFITDHLRAVLIERPYAVISVSAGRTLRPTYAVLRDAYAEAVDWKRVICVQMDEYFSIGSTDPRSMAFELQHDVVEPLGIGKFLTFYDASGTLICSLDMLEQKIRELGGIDCAMHGVGRNGHIAFNEPGAPMLSSSRFVQLADSTRVSNGVAFQNGVTLGLSILCEAQLSVIVLRGSEKRRAARALLFDPVDQQNPVGHLRSCNHVKIYLDPEAAPEGSYSSLQTAASVKQNGALR